MVKSPQYKKFKNSGEPPESNKVIVVWTENLEFTNYTLMFKMRAQAEMTTIWANPGIFGLVLGKGTPILSYIMTPQSCNLYD